MSKDNELRAMGEMKVGYVSIDGPPFRAVYDPTFRWNGWVGAPWFDRATAERICEWAKEDNTFTWDGDVLIHSENQYAEDEPGYVPERIEPNEDGLYCIGGCNWTWYEVEAPEEPEGSWNAPEDGGDPSVYGVGDNGLVWGGYRFATPEEVAANNFKGSDIRTESGRVLVLVDAAGAYRWRLENFPRGTDERD